MNPEQSTITHATIPSVTEFAYTHAFNYALQQAHAPIVRRLVLKNETEQDWPDIHISIALTPDFASVFEHRIDSLPAGGLVELDAVQMPVRSMALAELTERMEGDLCLKIASGNNHFLEQHYEIAILPYDHWQGVSLLPEDIAAFITPNHPQIPAIIRRAAEILAGWTGNPSFDAYQSRNPDRVRKQMAALYEAIAELELVYCTVPASFEERGQRVRLADAALAQKMGNCLDMSLLYAACMEAVGIHPLIIVVHGHAFAGAWLIEESFADAVSDDPSLLSKRIAAGINEIALVESTCMNAGKGTRFDDAVRAAENHLLDTASFVLFVDVKRARFSRIRPLPLRIATAGGFQLLDEQPQATRDNDAPLNLGETLVVVDGKPVVVGKQQLWERKLLDLTLRNNLLNLRVTKGTVQLIHISPAKLEDALANGAEFQMLPKPADWDNPVRSAGLYHALHDADPMLELAAHELSQKRLRCYLGETELVNNLTALYRSSRTALEENGANTLYIALGFLKWFETAASEVPRFAPLLLLPVELVRKSARQGFIIRSREEEPMMNITLLEKMRQDYGITIGGLDVLPRDESGVDVAQVFNIVRRAIMAQSRWNVEEQVVLGTFSFNKFILWNDIHNNADKLLQNKTVASLVSGKLEWTIVPNVIRNLDHAFSPSSLALPIASDSSQLEAVIASGEGQSFVLHGPPGTGKSQTITNIIANALFAGKKVLFVAAKKAALDVVESRLESIGIGPFCLELHSNKAKKTAIIEQLKRATTITHKAAPEGFLKEGERLALVRAELNEHVKALHQKWPFGLSLYDAFSRWSTEDATTSDDIPIPQNAIATLTTDALQDWSDIVRELSIVAKAVGSPMEHALYGTAPLVYTPSLRSNAAAALDSYSKSLSDLKKATTTVAGLLQIQDSGRTPSRTAALTLLANTILGLPAIPVSLITADAPGQTFKSLKAWTAQGRLRDAKKALLLQSFSSNVFTVDAASLLTAWNTASGKWFLPRWLGQSKIVKALKPYAKEGQLAKSAVPESLQALIDYSVLIEKVNGNEAMRHLAGFLYGEEETDWEAIDAAADAVVALNGAANGLTGPVGIKEWRAAFAASLGDGTTAFVSAYRAQIENLIALHGEVKQAATRVAALLHPAEPNKDDASLSWIDREAALAARWQSGLDALKDWCSWISVTQKAAGAGIEPVAQAFAEGKVAAITLEPTYRKSLYRTIATYILGQSPTLAAFNTALFEEKIARFKGLSESFEQLTRAELYARLAARIPDFAQEASQSSEVGILQKAIRSNGRAMSPRKLFDSIPNLLPRLMPCALMSPISVAQYFDAGGPKFDLVIFDEASQMPTCEAVGAIARGTTVIVVGDPKQMPPTSFFATTNVDEDNLEKEDLESILDDCLALSMPSKYLLWHYRSKHESLIAFSNAKYYENSLLTFPSTDDLATKVTAVHVPGFYDKGKTRQNKAEAQAIVAEIIRRLGNATLSARSIGVVTFSVVQQNLIEDLLTEEFRKAPHLEKIALEAAEPIFIKNLENVQGDERDVILFSVCYGPDEAGRISLNFGPLNRDGGWRRLNVAVSRARYEMQVFATLKSDQIDLARTSAEGVAGLKSFLAFAEKGKAALPVKAVDSVAVAAGLEASIANALREKGYLINQSVGCSGYRVDMGVVHPDKPHEYLLGIVCDGPAYGAAKTARDREVVQVAVLRTLGWNIHRVWAADWWEAPAAVLAGIIAAIEAAKKAVPAEPEPLPVAVATAAPEQENVTPSQAIAEPALDRSAASNVAPIYAKPAGNAATYKMCNLAAVTAASAELFLQGKSNAQIRNQLREVLSTEAPISKSLLYRRVLAVWSIGRAGTRITAHLDGIVNSMSIRQTAHGKQTFFWKEPQDPTLYGQYRLAANEAQKRDAEDLPPEEIAVAVRDILEQQLSLPRMELVKECARMFGYARLGTKVEEAMEAGIEFAIGRSFVRVVDGRIIYHEK